MEHVFNKNFEVQAGNRGIVQYTKEGVINLLMGTAKRSKNFSITNVTFIKDPDVGSNYYGLPGESPDGLTKITTLFVETDNGFRMTGETCECRPTSCSIGCDASYLGDLAVALLAVQCVKKIYGHNSR